MKKQSIIIFDFNRTLYDPDKRSLFSNVKDILTTFQGRGYILILISTAVASRNQLIDDLGIKDCFKAVVFSNEKSLDDYRRILEQINVDLQRSYVVGDRIKQEITFGNMLSLQTIWLKKGKFANEIPENEIEKPNFTINEIEELLKIAL